MSLFCSREIWARFLAFESNIGDLASILKVEKRRFTAFKEEYEGKETALLVDRYKFMDLYPCSASELKALGYKVSKNSSLLFFAVLGILSNSLFRTCLTVLPLARKAGKTGPLITAAALGIPGYLSSSHGKVDVFMPSPCSCRSPLHT